MITYRAGGYRVDLFTPAESMYRYHKYAAGLDFAYRKHGQAKMAIIDNTPDLVALGVRLEDMRVVGGIRFDVVSKETASFARLWPDFIIEGSFPEPRGAWSSDKMFSPVLARAVHHSMHALGFSQLWFSAGEHAMRLWRPISTIEPIDPVEYPKGHLTSLGRVDYGVMHPSHLSAFEHEREQLEVAA